MLDEFRSTSITWDKATRRIYSPITANASDSNGRKLNIQVVNSGQVENLTGATLHLYWETKDKVHEGLDAFTASDISKGEFELFYTTGMLSNVGELNATLVLVDGTGKVVSDWFKITVTRGINEGAIQSENSFSSLTQALIDVSNLEQNYAPRLNDLTAQLAQKTNQSYVDTQIQNVANGAPKIVESTLSALQTNHPTGSTDNALVTADGHIYTWNGTSWTDTGILYQATGVADGSLTLKKISGTVPGTNLFDKNAITDQTYLNPSTNAIVPNPLYNVSEFIPTVIGKSYTIHRVRSYGKYDSSKNLISVIDSINSTTSTTAFVTFVADSPYVRLSVHDDYLDQAMFSEGTVLPEYKKYERLIPDSLLQNPVKNKYSPKRNLVSYDFNNETLTVYAKYNDDEDIKFVFEKYTVNQLFAIHGVFKSANSDIEPKEFGTGTTINNALTDWIGPYYVHAVANGDGGAKARTGGAHGSNGDATTGNSTAVTDSIKIYADGKLVSVDATLSANTIDVHVVNRVQAYNTKTVGRYVLREKVHYQIVGSKVSVKVDIEPLEDIVIEDYYGQQAPNGYYTHVDYINGQYTSPQSVDGVASDAGTKQDNFCTKFILSKDGTSETLTLKMDDTRGLGKREWLPLTQPTAISREFDKSYMWLIFANANTSSIGDRLQWIANYEWQNMV